MTPTSQFWAIVPAAGIGKRMQSKTPKQYLRIGNKTILELTLKKLCDIPQIKGIIVAIAKDDKYYANLQHLPHNVIKIEGGNERVDSVVNGLKYLCSNGHGNDWALVHDAARPCVSKNNIIKLMTLVQAKQQGGLLASPVSDTLKMVRGGEAQETVDRAELWQAHTPQTFQTLQLLKAITTALKNQIQITDEASAMEHIGSKPLICPDSRENIKITQPEDLALAELILTNSKST